MKLVCHVDVAVKCMILWFVKKLSVAHIADFSSLFSVGVSSLLVPGHRPTLVAQGLCAHNWWHVHGCRGQWAWRDRCQCGRPLSSPLHFLQCTQLLWVANWEAVHSICLLRGYTMVGKTYVFSFPFCLAASQEGKLKAEDDKHKAHHTWHTDQKIHDVSHRHSLTVNLTV